ncbi:hypothetical protein JCM3774_000670 [Rhodotorula dairenensis]
MLHRLAWPLLFPESVTMLPRTALAVAATLTFASTATAADASSLLSGISSSCQSSVSSLLSSEFASCADVSGLIPVLTASGSVISPIVCTCSDSWKQLRMIVLMSPDSPQDSYLGTLCGSSNCSSSAIENATSVIDAGCASDLSSGNQLVTFARTVVANFNSVKEAVCLQQSSNSTYCVTDLLTKVQTALGTDITVSTLTSLNLSSLEKIPSSDVCDDCAHALTTKLVPILDSSSSSSSGSSGSSASAGGAAPSASAAAASGSTAARAKRATTSSASTSGLGSAISSYCGSSFLNGQVPSGIKEGSGSSSSSSGMDGNSAVSSSSLNSGAADLSTTSWFKVAGIAAAGVAGAAIIA